MRTFDITQWCDLVRGVAEPADAEEMREQLESGSSPARGDVEALERVAAVARADAEHEVPGYAVRIARAAANLGRARTARSNESRASFRVLPFEVLYDSLEQPAAAGTRGLEPRARHLVFEADRFNVDVRFELEPPARETVRPEGFAGGVLSGQILRRDGDAQPVPRTPVLVFRGDEIVSSSLSGPLGEFHSEGLPREELRLCVLVGDEECIEFPLSAS